MNATLTKPASTKLYNGSVISKAHAIRKATAAALNIPVRAISWSSSLRNAKKGSALKDAWNCPLNSIGHKINLFLWSPECPVVFWQEEVVNATNLSKSIVGAYLGELVKWGVLLDNRGYVSVVDSKRPYSNELRY